MKRIFLILILFSIFSLVACDPNGYKLEGRISIENVSSVDIIYYNNNKSEGVKYDINNILQFDFNKMEVIDSLSIELKEAFLKDFLKLTCNEFPIIRNSPENECLKITYNNGNFIIGDIKLYHIVMYNKTGNSINLFGGFDNTMSIYELIDKYFMYTVKQPSSLY